MALIQYLTPVHFAEGAIRLLPAELRRLGIRIPLLVTDAGLRAAGLVERVTALLPDFSSECIFDATPENPTEAAVALAADSYRRNGCDGIIALGGGSPIDLAKGVALSVTHAGSLAQYAAVAGGMERITSAVAPVIAIPTTAGSGSEVGRAAVLVTADGQKRALVSPHLLPRLALCDPELTHTLPPRLVAGTGMDAIAHGIETFLSPSVNPPADAIALDGLARGVRNIAPACSGDRAARAEMMMASLEGGLAFQKGLGAVHAMSHPLGALREARVHHGTANAIVLPAVLRFNAPVAAEKYARLRTTLGLSAGANLAEFFRTLTAQVGLPATLREVGVPRERLPELAQAAVGDFSARTNPRPASAADYLQMYEESYG